MSRSARIALVLIGLALVLCSLTALAFAFWPLQEISTQATLAPTLLTPP
ncbi:MAG: hypothetical protein JW726_09135 [Anaerolineales bacterium]|nr:hypothetical protein [Anaerolineales bacterium]